MTLTDNDIPLKWKPAKAVFSKQSDEWATPQDLFDAWNEGFHFGLDAAATKENRKCLVYFGPDHTFSQCRDAVAPDISWQTFAGNVWCNPPYSLCKEFVAKAAEERLHGVTTVMLLPSRTDTRWFHTHLWDQDLPGWRPGIQGHFIKGRLKFGGSKNSAPFPSLVVVFEGVK